MGKKKRSTGTVVTPVSEETAVVVNESDTASSNLSGADKDPADQQQQESCVVEIGATAPIFKSAKFLRALKSSSSAAGKRNRVWKSLKQLSASERCQPGSVTYAYIDAAPSVRPIKKYSDVSGLKARYTDPLTKLRFANVSEFQVIRTLSPESVNAHLAVRKAAPI